jgi:hypothetical protein
MSERELSRKERLVLSITARIRELVYAVQDEEAHMRFKPGDAWWIITLGASAGKRDVPGLEAVTQGSRRQQAATFIGKEAAS